AAGSDVVPLNLPLLRPAQECHAGQPGPIVADAHGRARDLKESAVEYFPFHRMRLPTALRCYDHWGAPAGAILAGLGDLVGEAGAGYPDRFPATPPTPNKI